MASLLLVGPEAGRQPLAVALGRAGHGLVETDSAERAWALLQDSVVDVLILDGGLPSLVDRVRGHRFLRQLPILVVADEPPEDRQIQGWLPWEHQPEDLLDLVVVLLRPRLAGDSQAG